MISTGKFSLVVYRTTHKAAIVCLNPSECLQLPSTYIPWSDSTSMSLSDYFNILCKSTVPTDLFSVGSISSQYYGPHQWKFSFYLCASIVLGRKKRGK